MADRDQQVCLAEAHAAVDEQRVVGGRGRRFGHGHRRGVRESVGRARNERVERVVGERQAGGAEAHRAASAGAAGDDGWLGVRPSARRRRPAGGACPRRRRTRSSPGARRTSAAASSISARWLCCRRSRTSGLGTDKREHLVVERDRRDVGEPHDDRRVLELRRGLGSGRQSRLRARLYRRRSVPYLFHKTFPHRWITRSGEGFPFDRLGDMSHARGKAVGTIARWFSTLHAQRLVLTLFLLSTPLASDDARILRAAGDPVGHRIE